MLAQALELHSGLFRPSVGPSTQKAAHKEGDCGPHVGQCSPCRGGQGGPLRAPAPARTAALAHCVGQDYHRETRSVPSPMAPQQYNGNGIAILRLSGYLFIFKILILTRGYVY